MTQNAPFDAMVVTALVVTYNSSDEIENLLDSLPAAADGLDLRVLVVDNSSSDDTVAKVEARGDARVVHAGGNVGYAAGINVGRENLDEDTDAIAILNPDLVMDPGSLRRLAEPLAKDRTVGVTVPFISNSDGTPFHSLRREPNLLSQLGEATFGASWARRPVVLGDTLRTPDKYQTARDVQWASGAALLISRACDQAVGEWREDFFLYSEETDFARRARQAGYRIRYVPEAKCLHIGGASGSSPQLEALMEVNKLRDYEGHHGRASSTLFRGILAAQHAVRAKKRPGSKAALHHLLHRDAWSTLPKGDPRPSTGSEA
ncbi:glycosyltransferase family 2 protein [Luteococcus japonicus]|uniref:Glycosyl transferase, family 2 n=1 Tax=Luteococcus japonicus LSP_Lj1 TaxID=1255658 RepID=A0A1R4KID1_9ACTN|nr:glycosyltransferase family 2 protein [Luteococcus japonicus]SJN43995.1 glycosyl transferase, family 2 [Luteococcus japonicus LSP_Lj1]